MYKINRTQVSGCIEIIPNIFNDHRGESIKPFHCDTFNNLGLEDDFKEDLMVTSHKGVLRGMHMQKPPYSQTKLIYCVRGSIFDVAIDLRKESLTYGQYVNFYIDSQKHNMAYIPAGFAHGYLVLENNTTVIYKMSSVYSPEHETGFRWDSYNIPWPVTKPILSEKDSCLPLFSSYQS